MDLKEIVVAAANAQGMLSPESEALTVTSLTVVEFVVSLEETTGIEIPNAEMTENNFRSISTVLEMLARLQAAAQLSKTSS